MNKPPEKEPFYKEISSSTHQFSRDELVLREVMSIQFEYQWKFDLTEQNWLKPHGHSCLEKASLSTPADTWSSERKVKNIQQNL